MVIVYNYFLNSNNNKTCTLFVICYFLCNILDIDRIARVDILMCISYVNSICAIYMHTKFLVKTSIMFIAVECFLEHLQVLTAVVFHISTSLEVSCSLTIDQHSLFVFAVN